MSSAKPAPDGSAAALFCQEQRLALLGDPAITEKIFGTTALCIGGKVFLFPWQDAVAVFASHGDRWPLLARDTRAFVGG
jgi:hypothetical protein